MSQEFSKDLPTPSVDEMAHSERLVEFIKGEIDATGSMGFRRYMELVLYAPAMGYYSAGLQKFGQAGDFVTAPEISPLFSRCLARQCAQVLGELGGGEVLEFGAGSGAMAADVLLELEQLNTLPARYLILELSGELRARQRSTIEAQAPHLFERVEWLDALPEPGIVGVVLGNEVLDAMPVQCFAKRGGRYYERKVVWRGDRFDWGEELADETLKTRIEALEETLPVALPDDYVSELNPGLVGWMQALGDCLERAAIVLIDYGYPRAEYYLPERRMGTLICHYRHRAHDNPFLYPGLQDITANVDFTAVAEAGAAAHMTLLGYTSQANFLIGNDLDALFMQAQTDDITQQLALAQQVKTLTLPSEMGERFQVIALGKNLELNLNGFSLRDFSSRL